MRISEKNDLQRIFQMKSYTCKLQKHPFVEVRLFFVLGSFKSSTFSPDHMAFLKETNYNDFIK